MVIGIIGYGVVGRALAKGFSLKHEVVFHDPYVASASFEDACKADVVFVCVPTPMQDDKIDLSIVESVVKRAASLVKGILVIKSTVVPGTTKSLAEKYPHVRFCFNPEFLTEKQPYEDFMNADRIVLGVEDEEVGKRMQEVYATIQPGVPVMTADFTTAELGKYMANALLATKVVFANEIAQAAENLGADYEQAKAICTADRRFGGSHLDVSEEGGFGGKCLPKDLVALIGRLREIGCDTSVLSAVWKKNLSVRSVRDWENIPFVTSSKPFKKIEP